MDEVNDFPSVSSDDSEVPQHTGSEDDDQGIRLGGMKITVQSAVSR